MFNRVPKPKRLLEAGARCGLGRLDLPEKVPVLVVEPHPAQGTLAPLRAQRVQGLAGRKHRQPGRKGRLGLELAQAPAAVGAEGKPDRLYGVVDERGIRLLENPQEGGSDGMGDERSVAVHEFLPGVAVPRDAAIQKLSFLSPRGHL